LSVTAAKSRQSEYKKSFGDLEKSQNRTGFKAANSIYKPNPTLKPLVK